MIAYKNEEEQLADIERLLNYLDEEHTSYRKRGQKLTNIIQKKLPGVKVEFRSSVDKVGWYIYHPDMSWSVWIANKWIEALEYVEIIDNDPLTKIMDIILEELENDL